MCHLNRGFTHALLPRLGSTDGRADPRDVGTISLKFSKLSWSLSVAMIIIGAALRKSSEKSKVGQNTECKLAYEFFVYPV